MYVVHKLHTRRSTYKAEYFYRQRLQKKVLNALSKNVLLKWKHIVSSTNNCTNKFAISVNCTKAETHYTKALLKQHFTRWCDYIATRHRKNALLQKANTFHNLYCLKKCIINWKVYIVQGKILQNKMDEVISIAA